jgi:glycosyltransferase involved in cell wall biosynthesis
MTRCGSLGFGDSSQYSDARRKKFGANVAELGLANAILEESPSLLWEVWSSEVVASLTKTHESRPQEPEMRDLRRKHGDRVQVRRLDALPEISTDPRYVFLANVSTFSRISELRSQIGAARMPICAVTHSLYTRELLKGFSWLLLSAEPHDVVVASSDAGRRTLENWFAAAVDRISARIPGADGRLKSPRIVKIPFGTAIPREEELDRERARSLLKLPSQSFVMLYFGRITEEYKADLDPLMQAMKHLEICGHNPSLVLAGQIMDRTYLAHLERRLAALGLRDKTLLIENCPEFLKTAVYAACDVVVSPVDSIQETFGLSILEAMAHSRPVVASNWSGYRELVEDGMTGFLVQTIWTEEASTAASVMTPTASPLAIAHYLAQRTIVDCGELIDKLTTLAENPGLRTSMGKAGRIRVEQHYGWKQVASKFLALWEDQFELAQNAERKPLDITLDKFSHYAGTTLSPIDLLARISGTKDVEVSVLNSFVFHSESARSQVRALLEITASHPVSVGDLRQEGFELDCILWLAKKGLRHIVSVQANFG